MIDSKQSIFLGIAFGFIFLFVLYVITFIVIQINKEAPLFDNIALPIILGLSLLILIGGAAIALFAAFRKSKL